MRTKSSVRARLNRVLSICFGVYALAVCGPMVAAAQEGVGWPLSTETSAEAGASKNAALREAQEAVAQAEAAAEEARAYAESLAAEAAREAELAAKLAELEALEAELAAQKAAREAEVAAKREAAEAAKAAEVAAVAEARKVLEAAEARKVLEAERAAEQAALEATKQTSSREAELEAAVERAEEAADEAWVAARAAERAGRDRKVAQETGPYLGVAAVYGAEEFDDDLVVKSSLGAAGFVGWRISQYVAAELRYTSFDGFDIQASNGEAEIDGYAVTLNAKLYPIRTRIQPFLVVGIGGAKFESNTKLNDGRRFKEQESDAVFRLGAGLDLPLSQFVKLNLEAAYFAPSDDLSNLDVTELSVGLTYQF